MVPSPIPKRKDLKQQRRVWDKIRNAYEEFARDSHLTTFEMDVAIEVALFA